MSREVILIEQRYSTAKVLVLVATQRGVFLLSSDKERRTWRVQATNADPSWSYNFAAYDAAKRVIYAAGHSAWYGPAVWRSADLGETWHLSSEGLTFGDHGPSLQRIWNITPAQGAIYAGVDPAGLFKSLDGGQTWQEVGTPLRLHPASASWRPGKGGLPVHSILPHPSDPLQLWLAMAGGGVLYTADGGVTWEDRNARTTEGLPALRVQKLVADPSRPERLVQQNHEGVFCTEDGGLTWQDVSCGLPTPFGFPMAVHPGAPPTLFAIPHHNEGGVRHVFGAQIAPWRSRDGGGNWERLTRGLPTNTAYTNVLRDAMATDIMQQPGLYFGTASGSVYGSVDGGDSWFTLAENLPEILGVSAAVIQPEEEN